MHPSPLCHPNLTCRYRCTFLVTSSGCDCNGGGREIGWGHRMHTTAPRRSGHHMHTTAPRPWHATLAKMLGGIARRTSSAVGGGPVPLAARSSSELGVGTPLFVMISSAARRLASRVEWASPVVVARLTMLKLMLAMMLHGWRDKEACDCHAETH